VGWLAPVTQAHRGAVEPDGTTKFERNEDERVALRALCAVICELWSKFAGRGNAATNTNTGATICTPQCRAASTVLTALLLGGCAASAQPSSSKAKQMEALTALKTNKAMAALMWTSHELRRPLFLRNRRSWWCDQISH
jgi:hypothetical protein